MVVENIAWIGEDRTSLSRTKHNELQRHTPTYTTELLAMYSDTVRIKTDEVDVQSMMTSSNGNTFRVTGHLCGEFTDDRWIPITKPVMRGFDVFSLICAWINGWVNNHVAGDLIRHRAHYDVTIMDAQRAAVNWHDRERCRIYKTNWSDTMENRPPPVFVKWRLNNDCVKYNGH